MDCPDSQQEEKAGTKGRKGQSLAFSRGILLYREDWRHHPQKQGAGHEDRDQPRNKPFHVAVSFLDFWELAANGSGRTAGCGKDAGSWGPPLSIISFLQIQGPPAVSGPESPQGFRRPFLAIIRMAAAIPTAATMTMLHQAGENSQAVEAGSPSRYPALRAGRVSKSGEGTGALRTV